MAHTLVFVGHAVRGYRSRRLEPRLTKIKVQWRRRTKVTLAGHPKQPGAYQSVPEDR